MAVRTLVVLLLIGMLTSCIDPYDPKLIGGERYLVFDGVLTDAPGPYRFALSQSAGYNSTESVYNQRVTGATVSVTDDAGRVTRFTDEGRGNYKSPAGFRGQVGRKYALTVAYKGQTYQSEPELMQAVPNIDSVYWTYQPKPTVTSRGYFAVFVDLTDPANAENYYQWDWSHYEMPDFCVLYTPPAQTLRTLNAAAPVIAGTLPGVTAKSCWHLTGLSMATGWLAKG